MRNWDKETKDTILKALDFYREAVLKQALAELEEAMLQERIASGPELQDKEITPELREELLEEIREH